MTTRSYNSSVRPICRLAIVAIGFALVSIGSTHCKALSSEGTGDPRSDQLKIPNSGLTSLTVSPIHMIESRVVDEPFGVPGRLETIGFKRYFVNSCPFFRNSHERQYGRAMPFGVKNATVRALIDQVCSQIYSEKLPYVQGESVTVVSHRLLNLVDRTLETEGLRNCPKFLRQWLVAEAICAWMVGQFEGDSNLAAEKSYDKWWSAIQPEVTLSQGHPKTICSGAAMLVRALANNLSEEVGLHCYYISGWFRPDNNVIPDNSNHAWNCFEFDQNIMIPADTVPAGYSRSARLKWDHKELPTSFLPLNREAWEVFLSLRWGSMTSLKGKANAFAEPMKNPNSDMSLADWKAIRLAPNFSQLSAWATDRPYE